LEPSASAGGFFAEITVDADSALKQLLEGNARFISGHVQETEPRDLRKTRRALSDHQKPFAIILGCSDSRVSPEIIFDQGLGELFDIRTAGHVVDELAIGSIEYGVEHLGCELVMVLGHESCGAVTAAVEGGEAPGSIAAVVEAIQPAVEATKGQRGDPVANAVRANAINVAEQLYKDSEIIAAVTVVAAQYDLNTGRVDIIEGHRRHRQDQT
jgi:carbonic anhydrase